jgi:hypothetical protein
MLKNIEDFNLDAGTIQRLCDELIHEKSGGRPIVVSDETLTETPQLHFAPYTMPRDTIALRLHRLFPAAKIVFTIRDQRRYAESMYLNLKRNAAYFDRMPTRPFSEWLDGALRLLRSNYLQNLNFLECIGIYAGIFGRENICVMPLEMAVDEGVPTYLGRLCAFMGLEFQDADVANYLPIHNRRMSVHQELVAELLEDDRFGVLYAEIAKTMGSERLAALLDDAPRSAFAMPAADEAKICQRVGISNWLLAREFGLDLARYGYPLAQEHELGERRLVLAEEQFAFDREAARLRGTSRSERVLELRRSAEITALRAQLHEMADQLDLVSASPVWHAVKRVENVRRSLLRAAAMISALAASVRKHSPTIFTS